MHFKYMKKLSCIAKKVTLPNSQEERLHNGSTVVNRTDDNLTDKLGKFSNRGVKHLQDSH